MCASVTSDGQFCLLTLHNYTAKHYVMQKQRLINSLFLLISMYHHFFKLAFPESPLVKTRTLVDKFPVLSLADIKIFRWHRRLCYYNVELLGKRFAHGEVSWINSLEFRIFSGVVPVATLLKIVYQLIITHYYR